MKKLISLSLISASMLFAGPVHDLMDSKLKGKSFGGTLDDHEAASDGLGIIPLNGYSPSRDVANELIETKIFKKVLKSETDKNKISHIRNSLSSGLVGTIEDKNILSNVGVVLNYVPGTLSSCSDIKSKFPVSQSGIYQFSDGFMAKCDMSSTGVELYNNNLNSCIEIENRFDITTRTTYILANGSTVTCNSDGSVYVPYTPKTNVYEALLRSTSPITLSKYVKVPVGTNKLTLKFDYSGDFDHSSEYASIYIDGVNIGKVGGVGSSSGTKTLTTTISPTKSQVLLKITPTSGVNIQYSGYAQSYRIYSTTSK